MIESFSSNSLWIVILSYVIAFILAFGIGANDVANSFGTSVGSKVLTMKQACTLATILEIAGSLLIGGKVSSTVRTGVFDLSVYKDEEQLLMLGYLSALIGGAFFNNLATFFKFPISGTHSIVGSVIGFTLVAKSLEGFRWSVLSTIVLSWFISPILSGLVSVLLYVVIEKYIITKPDGLERGLKALPLFYGMTIFINLFSIVHNGPSYLYLDEIEWWASLIIAAIFGLSTFLAVCYFVIPYKRKVIKAKLDSHKAEQEKKKDDDCIKTISDIHLDTLSNVHLHEISLELNEITNGKAVNDDKEAKKESFKEKDEPEIAYLFKYLQILTACFGSFAHGGNDVSNAIGPLIAVVLIWKSGVVTQEENSPFYLMLFGGVGISIGLIVWGRKVIQTVGEDLAKITPSTGFTIEMGSALTVLIASKMGLPISTTHCKVGSVVFVGHYKGSKNAVNWKLFIEIITVWLLTVPVSAICSALSMYILISFVPLKMNAN